MTLAAHSTPSGAVIGPEALTGLTAVALGPMQTAEVFGFVNIQEDGDGATRRARITFVDRVGNSRDSWAARAARALGPLPVAPPGAGFRIDHTVDWQAMGRVSWKDLPVRLERNPGMFRNRLVLLGGDFLASGDDYHRVPARAGAPAAVSGVVLQALVADTILAGFPVREAGALRALSASAALCGLVLLAALCLPRTGVGLVAAAALLTSILAAWVVFHASRILVPVAVPLLAQALALAAGLALRSRLAPLPGLPQEDP